MTNVSDGIKAEVDWVALRFWAILAKTSSSSNELSLYLSLIQGEANQATSKKYNTGSKFAHVSLAWLHSQYHTLESRIKIDQSHEVTRLVRFGHYIRGIFFLP